MGKNGVMRKTWTNWAGNQVAHPVAISHPTSEAEVSEVVRLAAETGSTVKVAASGHSFTSTALKQNVVWKH